MTYLLSKCKLEELKRRSIVINMEHRFRISHGGEFQLYYSYMNLYIYLVL